MMPIGEKVLYMPLKDSRDRKNNLEPKFEYGIWAGIEPGSSEAIILTQEGVRLSRSVRRLPFEERYDKQLLKEVKGRPWDKKAAGDEEEVMNSVKINVTERRPEEVPPIPELEVDEPKVRRYKIERDIIEEYGMTPKCYGCRAIMLDIRQQPHSEECRRRITELIKDTQRGKEKIAQEKIRESSRQEK
eukprot:12236724-Karenia_brevis.AAC.1